MRRFITTLGVVGVLTIGLAACDRDTLQERVSKAQSIAQETCGVIPRAADLVTVFSAGNPVVTGAAAVAKVICEQYTTFVEGSSQLQGLYSSEDACIAIVNDVCVREEIKDNSRPSENE